MDCYFEELRVPNYQESSSETYPCNGMWGGWSMNSPEAAEKCFGFSGEGLLGMRRSEEEEEEESKRSKAFYSASSLDDFEGIEHMDDIFLSSILEDVPGNDGDVLLASSSSNSVGSSSMYGGRDVPMFHCHDMPLKEEAPFTISDLSEEVMLDSQYVDEQSSEALVLQDLQRASQKLTDETRKCFRDTFYRLAKNSLVKLDSVSNNSEEFNLQETRLSREGEILSETNSMDRAIANLTFNKMESNISNFPLSERVQ